MNGLSFDSIAGPVTVGKDHQLVRPATSARSSRDGGLGWKVVAEAGG